VPFVSGKDSLNNEFALDEGDVEPLLATLQELRRSRGATPLPEHVITGIRERRRLAIPPTLLISALSIVPDVRRCVTPDLKSRDETLLLVGQLAVSDYDLRAAAGVHRCVAGLIADEQLSACHDVSDGGWLVAVAEMAIAGDRGAALEPEAGGGLGPWDPATATYVLATSVPDDVRRVLAAAGVRCETLGKTHDTARLTCGGSTIDVGDLRAAWYGEAVAGAAG
jgi:phosphoribosylformylglycinamidine (FGAM) synthase-like enzyme